MKTRFLLSLIWVAALSIFGIGCSDDEDKSDDSTSLLAASCIGCHANQEMLIATMAPDTTPEPENPGEG